MNASTCLYLHKRAQEVKDLGEKPIIKKGKFEARVIVKLKELGKDDPKKSVRDLEAAIETVISWNTNTQKNSNKRHTKRKNFGTY